MSMQEYPNSGYVVPATDLTKLMRDEFHADYLKLIEAGEYELASQFFLVNSFYDRPDFFQLSDEDTPDEEMKRGVVYASFPEDDLYVKELTPIAALMLENGVKPELRRWSIWG